VPVHGYSSLALLAASALATDEAPDALAAALVGGHGEIFVQRFAAHPFREASALASMTPDHAAGSIPDRLVIGSGADSLVEARLSGEARACWPRAADLGLLPAGFTGLPATPIYGRPPDAKPAA
jgi:tRNA A37 threonylcarbamoyladenosine modification protein TsaB